MPLSVVWNESMSVPSVVSVGAAAPDHFTDAGHVTVCEPPFVSINVKLPLFPLVGGFEKVKVVALVSTVAVTTFPKARSMSWVPPPMLPMLFIVSA